MGGRGPPREPVRQGLEFVTIFYILRDSMRVRQKGRRPVSWVVGLRARGMTREEHLPGRGRWARLRRMAGRAGGTAIEFAIVGSVFLLFVCMILENGIILFTQASLDNATRDAARLIMIGSAQGSNSSVFSTQLCNDLSNFIACPAAKSDLARVRASSASRYLRDLAWHIE